MRPSGLAIAAVLVAASVHPVAADPAPAGAGALFAAEVAAGDWRLHPDVEVAQPWTQNAVLSVDAHGLHGRHGTRLALAAAAVAFVGALLIASSRSGSWCSGARCDVGEVALLAAAPLLDAAARESEGRR